MHGSDCGQMPLMMPPMVIMVASGNPGLQGEVS